MTLIHLLDGTTEQKYGIALRSSFSEIAKYQRIQVSTTPGGIDLPGYRLVKKAERRVCNYKRDQVNLKYLLRDLLNGPRKDLIGQNSFTLIEKDLYDNHLDWCFGAVISDKEQGKHLVMSIYRFNDPRTLAHVATHEFGHMFGAASRGRSNTEMNLGSHCTNVCVMQQKLTGPDMDKQAKRLSSRDNKFCYQCQEELKKYV
jgi:predicted Zn-dependent protease